VEAVLEADVPAAWRAGERCLAAVGERPAVVRDGEARVVLMHAGGKRRARAVERNGLVAGGTAGADGLRARLFGRIVFHANAPGDGRAVRIARNRPFHGQAAAAGHKIALPATRDDGVALRLEEAVVRPANARRADVVAAERCEIAAINHVIDERAVAAAHVDRL